MTTTDKLPEDLIPEPEAATVLRIKTVTLRSWQTWRGMPKRYAGITPPECYLLPKGRHYSKSDLERFMRALRVDYGSNDAAQVSP